MKQSQSKDIIGKVFLALALLFLGEGIFYWGGYWVLLLLLVSDSSLAYWVGFLVGIAVSALTNSPLGLASGLIVVVLFVYSRVTAKLPANPILLVAFAILANFGQDFLLKSRWSIWEAVFSGLLVLVLTLFGYQKEDLRLRT